MFSLEVLQDFLKKEKIRSKKLLNRFQKDKEIYLALQKKGIWVPIPQINSIEYLTLRLKIVFGFLILVSFTHLMQVNIAMMKKDVKCQRV